MTFASIPASFFKVYKSTAVPSGILPKSDLPALGAALTARGQRSRNRGSTARNRERRIMVRSLSADDSGLGPPWTGPPVLCRQAERLPGVSGAPRAGIEFAHFLRGSHRSV